MKSALLSSVILFILAFSLTSSFMDDNGKAGYVGAPNETTCNTSQCHNSFTVNSGGGFLRATSTMNNWTYDPNTVYSISVTVGKTGLGLFGFGTEILTATNNNAGTLTITDAVHTQIKSKTFSGVSRKNVVHKLNSGTGQDSMTFTFNWTSPDTATGNITMYFAGNASNSNNNSSGDYIYTASQIISPALHTGMNEIVSSNPFNVFPNPSSGQINLHYTLSKNENVCVKIYSLDGSLNEVILDENRLAGSNNESLALPDKYKPGVYLICIESPSGRAIQKLTIQ